MSAVPIKSTGGKIALAVKKANRNLKKHAIKYILAYVLFFGIITLFLRKLEDYEWYYYPIIVSLEKAIFLYSIFLYRDRLKFCVRKEIIILSLFFYEFFNAITVAFQLGETIYTNTISYLLLTTAIVTILLTIYNNERNEP